MINKIAQSSVLDNLSSIRRLKEEIIRNPDQIPDDIMLEYLLRYFYQFGIQESIINSPSKNIIIRTNFYEFCFKETHEFMTDEELLDTLDFQRFNNYFEDKYRVTVHGITEYLSHWQDYSENIERKIQLYGDDIPIFPINKNNRLFFPPYKKDYRYSWNSSSLNSEFNRYCINEDTFNDFIQNLKDISFVDKVLFSYNYEHRYMEIIITLK